MKLEENKISNIVFLIVEGKITVAVLKNAEAATVFFSFYKQKQSDTLEYFE